MQLLSRGRLAQAGVLVGIGAVFVGGAPTPSAEPPPACLSEGQCTIRKPRLLFALDYGTAMNAAFDGQQTRWQAAVASIGVLLDSDNGFVVSNFMLGLLRFGHDPDGNTPGSKIPGDTTGLVDAVKLDVPMYAVDGVGKPYFECTQGDAIHAALDALPAPLNGAQVGLGSWTRGGLELAGAYMQQLDDDHPEDTVMMNRRLRAVVVVTQGVWTSRNGANKLLPTMDDPEIVAASLLADADTPTYVISVGDAMGKLHADQLAAAGGTTVAYASDSPALLEDLKLVIDELVDAAPEPVCQPGRPRLMVLVDASSPMLNTVDGTDKAPPGEGAWDLARAAIAGDASLLQAAWGMGSGTLEYELYTGLAVFGGAAPAEEALLLQYAGCAEANRVWALDPSSSCVAPGCVDPHADAPITWTFLDGSLVSPPGFAQSTLSHVPLCDQGPAPSKGCFGSKAYTDRGLALVADNLATYKSACASDPVDPCNDATVFRNLLVTRGLYDSTDAQVQAQLQALFAAGVTTYVLAVGTPTPQAEVNLANMAAWGSGGAHPPFTLATAPGLAALLAAEVEAAHGPCCVANHCGIPNEPDPTPQMTTSEPGETGTSATSGAPSSSGADETDAGGTTDSGGTSDTDSSTSSGSTAGDEGASTDPNPTAIPVTTSSADDTLVPTDGGADVTGGEEDGGSSSTIFIHPEFDPSCACSGTAPGAGAPLLLVPLLVRRRRRR